MPLIISPTRCQMMNANHPSAHVRKIMHLLGNADALDDGELAALRRVTFQRLLEHAEDTEIWIRPFVDQDESTFSQQAQIGRLSWSDSLAATACRSPRTLIVVFLQNAPPRDRECWGRSSRRCGHPWAYRASVIAYVSFGTPREAARSASSPRQRLCKQPDNAGKALPSCRIHARLVVTAPNLGMP